ncbi:hypothetical protein BDE02_01G363300 [Populus trichocarpa]|jgi:hypothetical protein|nr:hypothetical protein BDE02_01G363300 [Populus trichocarpa]
MPEHVCLKNCSCTAYSNLDIREGGSGCFLWFGDLVDIRVSVEKELEIYSRMAASEQPNLWINHFLILGPNNLH